MTTVVQPVRGYSADVLLRDGASLHLRAIQPEDKPRLRDHFHRLGPESIRQRFFGMKKELTDEDLRYFTELDFEGHVGLVGTHSGPAGEQFVVVGRYFRLEPTPEGVQRAEFALAVADEWQGRGAGTAMLEHLARLAAEAGIERFEADAGQPADARHARAPGLEVASSHRASCAWFPVARRRARGSDARVRGAAQSMRAPHPSHRAGRRLAPVGHHRPRAAREPEARRLRGRSIR
jgi:GNAT superfamily N-acetyltransferase